MVGILGLGSHATLHFLQRLNEVYQEKNGGYSTFPCVVLNTDFNRINPYLPNNFDVLLPIISEQLKELVNLEVQHIVVPNITLHEAIDQLGSKIGEMLIHPLKLAQNKAKELNKKKVVIVGTCYSMESDYVSSFFDGMERVELSESQKEVIDGIRKKVYNEGSSIEQKERLLICIEQALDEETILVIACTELSLLMVQQENCLDLLELMVQESIK